VHSSLIPGRRRGAQKQKETSFDSAEGELGKKARIDTKRREGVADRRCCAQGMA